MNESLLTPGQRMSSARKRLGMTQQKLADSLNDQLKNSEIVERSTISRWEKDKNFPSNGRRQILETVLDISLGNPPLRRDTSSTYVTTRLEISTCITSGLQHCSELWMTAMADQHSVYNEINDVKMRLQQLREDPNCNFRDLYYIRNIEELDTVKSLAQAQYPNYTVRIRTAPGHPFPVLLAPNNRFGMFLSGFFDDVSSVALELNGQVAGFNEHYLRHIWHKASPLFEDNVFIQSNYENAVKMLAWFGGDIRNEFSKSPLL